MGTITSSVGLISGINTGEIINELMSIESQPVTVLENQLATTSAQQQAYTALTTQLSGIQSIGQTLEKPDTFGQTTATSSNDNVLTATTTTGAAAGTYTFQVAQTVNTQQLISQGFTDTDSARVGAGNITIEMGGGEVSTTTALSDLNGGAGVSRGEFRITDRAGNSTVIDTSSDVSLDDVVKQINTSLDVSVNASVQGNHLVLTDTTGQTTGNLVVSDISGGSAASDLGIAGSSSTGSITGTAINYISASTSLKQLNDGRGVQTGTNGDFNVTLSNGSTVSVNLATAATVGDVLNAINTAGAGKLTAAINSSGMGIQLTDTTGSGGMTVTQDAGSEAATDLGIAGGSTGNTLTGKDILAGIDTTLLSSLNGGSGLSLGKIALTDRSGATATVDLSSASTVQDVLDDINNAGIGLTASLKSSGNGIQITDDSGGTGNIVIADADGGTSAEKLGIAGTFGASTTAVQGADLHRQWVTDDTELSTLNGGKGIADGTFTITNAAGAQTTVDVDSSVTTVGQLLYQINSKDLAGVTASINADGNGISLTDTSTGAGKLTVADVSSTTASDLNIKGTATTNTIDGAYEKTIAVTANDTLSTVQAAINNLGWGVSASIINDGSSTAPYRLSVTADNSGTAGQVVFDSGTTNLGTYNLVNAQDAAVFIGSSSAAKPLLVTSSTNQVTNVISGVTINLNGVSDSPVTLTVAPDPSGITTQLTNLTSTFNTLVESINTLTAYDTTTNQGGLLLGDSTTQTIQSDIYSMIDTVVDTGDANIRTLADVGITVGDNAELTFDQNVFNQAYAENPQAVEKLFNATTTVTNADGTSTTTQQGIGYAIDNTLKQLIDPVDGSVTIESQGLTTQTTSFQSQIDSLNQVLSDKRNLLETQFANMETVLAGLESQQDSLSSLTDDTSSSSSSSKSS